MVLQAQGNYQDAIAIYRESSLFVAEPGADDLTAIDIRAVVQGLTECYLALCDWKGMSDWMQQLDSLRLQYARVFFKPHCRQRHVRCVLCLLFFPCLD